MTSKRAAGSGASCRWKRADRASGVARGLAGLLRLLCGRQRLLQQAGDAGEAVGGRVDGLLALADLVKKRAQRVSVLVRFCEVK